MSVPLENHPGKQQLPLHRYREISGPTYDLVVPLEKENLGISPTIFMEGTNLHHGRFPKNSDMGMKKFSNTKYAPNTQSQKKIKRKSYTIRPLPSKRVYILKDISRKVRRLMKLQMDRGTTR